MSPHTGPSHYRIVHHIASEPTTVLGVLTKHFNMQLTQGEELLALGAIYKDRRRVESDLALNKGDYLRIHLHPKRFPVETVDWRRTLVRDTPEFVLVDKPQGIPVHATVDNARDNVLHQLRLLTRQHLLVTQRLDIPVGGLMILARTPKFQTRFNNWLLERKVHKRYRALTQVAPPVARHVHYMQPSERAPKVMDTSEREGWLRCELTVHDVVAKGELFESDIELHTGRTHQIRAQLKILGCPVVGDRLYGSRLAYPWPGTGERIGLFSYRIAWPNPGGRDWEFAALPPWN